MMLERARQDTHSPLRRRDHFGQRQLVQFFGSEVGNRMREGGEKPDPWHLGLHTNDRTTIAGVTAYAWNDTNISTFIDSL